ncbi:MAG TPA: carboxypeptidase-like regulatory domain-containing protein [Thermoanaerobaculia bacterium]|nr:carboxypeptidase-like regulatory domain-containing protein [Thermoanaerobaculia bacterium]
MNVRRMPGFAAMVALTSFLGAGTALGQTRVISGSVVDSAGQPLSGITVRAAAVEDFTGHGAMTISGQNGVFTLTVAAGVYAITAEALPPRGLARARADARGADVESLVLAVPDGPAPFVPDDPPKANLIHLGTPDVDGVIDVRGNAGAVPGDSYVIVIALRTGLTSTLQARADGSFETQLRAPHGAWVMIKHDPIGDTYSRILFELHQGGEGSPAPLPGTMLRVSDPPGPAGLTFGDEGLLSGHGWRVEGTIDKSRLQHGEQLTAQVKFVLESPTAGSMEKIPLSAHLLLERLSGDGVLGSRQRSIFTSHLMTPTGFPIEKGENYQEAPGFARFDTTRVSATRSEASFSITMPVSPSLPPGHYRAAMRFFFETRIPPAERPPHLTTDKPSRQPGNFAYLPLVIIGDPPSPRLPVMLLAGILSNATQGIRAVEDEASFGLASRVALQADRFVIPRVDVATGAPIRYRLEPYLPTISTGDRGIPPDSPQVPFRLPSGALTVRIEKPGGAVETLGPVPFVQPRTKTIVDRHGVALIPGGSGGMVTEPYQLSTMDPRFEYAFGEDGLHRVRVEMTVEDERGITWHAGGTYEIEVGR